MKKKLDFCVDYQELGFPKLKNLLNTLSDKIIVGLSKSNNNYLQLKDQEKAKYVDKQNSKLYDQVIFLNKAE